MGKAATFALLLLITCGGILTAAQAPRAAVPRSNTYPFAQPLFFRVQGNDCFSTCRNLNLKVVQSGRTTTGSIPNPPRCMCAGPADGDTRLDIGEEPPTFHCNCATGAPPSCSLLTGPS